MDYLELEQAEEEEDIRKRKVYLERYQPLSVLDDSQLCADFRFPKRLIENLVEQIRPFLEHPTNKSMALSAEMQTMIALKFFATGDDLNTLKDVFGIHLSSVSRAITRVTEAIYKIRKNHIKFPVALQDLNKIKQEFFEIASFPNVIGAVDGTHVPIAWVKKEDEHMYVCRKGGHSINCQIICDAKLIITDVLANYPGTSHDSYIFSQSEVGQKFVSNEFADCWLLGDSGYPLKPYLLTPIINPRNANEKRYTDSHCRTRNVVERCIGVLKARWRCLDRTTTLRFVPQKCCKVIYACCVLHNIARRFGVELANDASRFEEPPDPNDNHLETINDLSGKHVRAVLINRRFT